jgi:hypothetical protein
LWALQFSLRGVCSKEGSLSRSPGGPGPTLHLGSPVALSGDTNRRYEHCTCPLAMLIYLEMSLRRSLSDPSRLFARSRHMRAFRRESAHVRVIAVVILLCLPCSTSFRTEGLTVKWQSFRYAALFLSTLRGHRFPIKRRGLWCERHEIKGPPEKGARRVAGGQEKGNTEVISDSSSRSLFDESGTHTQFPATATWRDRAKGHHRR